MPKSDLASETHQRAGHKTDTLFVLVSAKIIVSPTSRLVVYPERFSQDPVESRYGWELFIPILRIDVFSGIYLTVTASNSITLKAMVGLHQHAIQSQRLLG